MRCNAWRWLWGLIPIAMMGWVAVLAHREDFERDLAVRAKAELDRTAMGWAKVAFIGRDAVVSGRSPDSSAPEKALQSVHDTWGVRTVENRIGLADQVDKYVFIARRDANRIRLEGHVPSEAARREIADLAKSAFPTARIEDKLVITRGAPDYEVWLAGIAFGLKQLLNLDHGQIDLEQTELSIRGEPTDAQSHDRLQKALAGDLPRGVSLRREALRAPAVKPYALSAKRAGRSVSLTGHVPDDDTRRALRAALLANAPDIEIDDRTVLAGGEPPEFGAALALLLRELGRLDEALVEVTDDKLSITGIADSKATVDIVLAALQRLPASFVTSHRLSHRVATISPYVTQAVAEGGAIVLTGHAGNAEARRSIGEVAMRLFAGREVRNNLEIGLGEGATWERCLELGLEALRVLDKGRAVLVGRQLEVTGVAESEDVAQKLTEALRDDAGADCATETRITFAQPKPRVVEAAKPSADEDDLRKRSEAAAVAEEQRRQYEEQQERLADEQRRRAVEQRRLADEQTRRKATAEAALAEEQTRRTEDAARRRAVASAGDDDDRRRLEDFRQRAAAAAAAEVEVQRRREIATECQDALRKVVREGIILFDFAKADLDSDSHETLDRITRAVNGCPDFNISIEGHTDSDGAPDRNQRLSERRARAVVDYLVRNGVPKARLIAVGHGQSRNIVPNDTSENKAKNRRIEFNVVD